LACCVFGVDAIAWQPAEMAVRSGDQPLRLQSDELTESSGLAFSRRDDGYVWSHNDSGDRARLFAFDQRGVLTGGVQIVGARASDFEDMASFDDDGPRLLVADVGDNDANRSTVSLYLFDEPPPQKRTRVRSFQHIVVRYPGGAENCESVAVDVERRQILLLGKSALVANLHGVPLPPRDDSVGGSQETGGDVNEDDAVGRVWRIEVTAEPIAKVAIPMATGMELCPRTGDLWVSGYWHAYRYANPKQLPWPQLVNALPEMVELPKLKQIEAIAVDSGGRVWVTSEGRPALMQRVIHSP
jgi:hypothetical protein